MAEKDNVFTYTSFFGSYEVKPTVNTYRDWDNLYMGLECFDKEFESWERFGDITVNICPLPYLESAIDTNNNGSEILNFLEDNGFAVPTGKSVRSGFCVFPIYRFNEAMLEKIDPVNLAEYRRHRGMDKAPLDNQIQGAVETRAAEKRLHATIPWQECLGQTVIADPPPNISSPNVRIFPVDENAAKFNVYVFFDNYMSQLAYCTGHHLEITGFNPATGVVDLYNKDNDARFSISHTHYLRDIGSHWTPKTIRSEPDKER
ncbi:MAG: DUF4313 domain-containing protein [Clostridia bacterium]|nr:DUF4313 domain-containing protein [Clostridia bacterium]